MSTYVNLWIIYVTTGDYDTRVSLQVDNRYGDLAMKHNSKMWRGYPSYLGCYNHVMVF